ncbi:hypothetical protein CHS0354_026604 [Potamilus streckersoni]|uniref:Uncharacterized protein n=1 Tax=Potamilus streckersoni TaxID=2493646 RepID=A0AAE0SUI8_9BIVA|nr:hypothetical protein CHS0354_026604 [Potamilus streckersoni]
MQDIPEDVINIESDSEDKGNPDDLQFQGATSVFTAVSTFHTVMVKQQEENDIEIITVLSQDQLCHKQIKANKEKMEKGAADADKEEKELNEELLDFCKNETTAKPDESAEKKKQIKR